MSRNALATAVVGVFVLSIGTGTSFGDDAYHLGSNTGFVSGCQGPCLCPVSFNESVSGTFDLDLLGIIIGIDGQPTVEVYEVSNIEWTVVQGEEVLTATGSGFYTVEQSPAPNQRMELDLSLNGGEAERYDSGLVPVDVALPDLQISVRTEEASGPGLLDGPCWFSGFSINAMKSGDADHDRDVDLVDFADFQLCYGTEMSESCEFADFDADEDVDLADFAQFQLNYDGGILSVVIPSIEIPVCPEGFYCL